MAGKSKKEKIPKKTAEEKVVNPEQAEDANQAAYINEITEKIKSAKSIDDLEALQERVHEIWGGIVPALIQDLASKKGEQLFAENPPLVEPEVPKEELQSGWVKVTMLQVKEAEADGKLRGFDESTMTADIAK